MARYAAPARNSIGQSVRAGQSVGHPTAWALSGTLSGMLFGVPREDPVTALVVVQLVTAVGLVATLVPAFRATRVDPLVVLRS
jgi:ABC-type antimicrobial peptide transport system permease subunit